MTCDASDRGLGAVLYQKQDGINRVISFASRTLSEAERKYHSGKLEFLALKWAVTDKFSDYLKYGPSFIVYTDNNPLTYVLTSAKLNAVGLRWVAELADYDFEIKYRPGRVNTDADYLSRNAMTIDEYIKRCTEMCAPEIINSVISSADVCSVTVGGLDVKVLSLDAENKLQKVDNMKLADDQKSDEVIGPVYELVLKGCRPGIKEW